ncbi:MAG: S8 family peptidase [Oligosphaeraceae bacterium]
MTERRLAFALLLLPLLVALLLLLTGPTATEPSQDATATTARAAATPATVPHRRHATATATATQHAAAPIRALEPSTRTQPPRRLLVTCRDEAQRRALIQALQAQGFGDILTLARLPVLAVAGDHRAIRQLLQDFPGVHWELDQPLVRPDISAPRSVGNGAPFLHQLLPWLGIDPSTAGRGQGVTIAVLDEPIAATASIANAALTQLDLFGLDTGAQTTGHGNAIASIIAADSNVLQGIAPEAAILSIPVLDPDGNGSIFTLAAAISAAAEQGASIISLSLGTTSPSPLLQTVIDQAAANGIVIVAAAGNHGSETPFYPAACANVISVAACDADGNPTDFSNYGSHIDIAAPGLDLAADIGDADGLVAFSGTSAAAPCVAATLAALLAANPDLTPEAAAAILLEKAIDGASPGHDPQTGDGLLNYTTAANWDNPAYTDAAVAGFHLDLAHDDGTATPLICSAQNLGNTTLPTLTLTANANGQTVTQTFTNVLPGQTVSAAIPIPNDQRDDISVSTHLDVPAVAEHSLLNNHKSVTIKLQP